MRTISSIWHAVALLVTTIITGFGLYVGQFLGRKAEASYAKRVAKKMQVAGTI